MDTFQRFLSFGSVIHMEQQGSAKIGGPPRWQCPNCGAWHNYISADARNNTMVIDFDKPEEHQDCFIICMDCGKVLMPEANKSRTMRLATRDDLLEFVRDDEEGFRRLYIMQQKVIAVKKQ